MSRCNGTRTGPQLFSYVQPGTLIFLVGRRRRSWWSKDGGVCSSYSGWSDACRAQPPNTAYSNGG